MAKAETMGRVHCWVRALFMLSILFATSLVSFDQVHAADSEITIDQFDHSITYGEKIEVSSTLGIGPTPVTSARALFRPRGGETVWSYSYPQAEISSTSVSINFEIPTGAGSYYPPGTEFDVEFELTFGDESRESVRHSGSIEYLDPGKPWKRRNGDGYEIVYYGVDEQAVTDLISHTNSRIPRFKSVLGVSSTPNYKAIVFPTVADATPSFPPVSQTATDQLLFAGFAQPQYRLFVQGRISPTTFIHELAHLYTHEAISSVLTGGIPSWLNEGLARFLETGSPATSLSRLKSSTSPEELLSLRNMNTIPGQRSDVFIFYPQSGAIVGYIVEEYGDERMAEFLALMNRGRSLNEAFELVYDATLHEVENRWREMYGASPLPLSTPTPIPTLVVEDTRSTPVPLVDFSAPSSGSKPVESLNPTTVPQATPTFPTNPTMPTEQSDPNILVDALAIGLSIVVGVWLFLSRRGRPPKSDG